MSRSYFEDLGILGWGELEPIILGAILCNKAVLLNGSHGANKTEGAQLISKAAFGENTKFVPYDTSLVNADDLLGFLHPKKLAEGELEYIGTPDSIWDATSCLLDEINRCNPYNAAKFFEIVRSRTINGRETKLEFVWAACNPPDRYNTSHMDAAQVSRFVVLDVPDFQGLSPNEQRTLLRLKKNEKQSKLKEMLESCRSILVNSRQVTAIESKVIKIANVLNKTKDIKFSGRQVRDLYSLFINMDKISQVFKELDITETVLCRAVMGLVPETTGLIRTALDKNKVEAEIAEIMHGFRLSDPVLTASNVVELCKARIKDTGGHVAAIADMVYLETDTALIEEAWQAVVQRTDINPDMFNTLRQVFASRAAFLGLGSEAKLVEAGKAVEKELKNYGPKAKGKGRRKVKKGAQ